MSKHSQIREHLLSGHHITGLIALNQYGVYRLSSVINRLRNEGIPIITKIVHVGNYSYAKYFIE